MALDAVLFDIDGTLLDTNDAHVEAWRLAMETNGYRIARDRIKQEIGKGGDKLVPAVLGRQAEEHDGERLRSSHAAQFERIVRSAGIKPLPDALPLLAAVRKRQLRVALATSASKKNLRVMEEVSGIALFAVADLIVTIDDCSESKPSPDIVATAVGKLKLSPAQCALIGDSGFDMQAATLAGVVGLGVLTGFQSRQSLLRSGARCVYTNATELLAQLDEALRSASPSAIRITSQVQEELMREALAEAQRGSEAGEVPIGCVIADGNGKVIGRGHNQVRGSGEPTAHAEMIAFRSCAGKIPLGSKDYMMVSTLEPCVMCLGAAMESGIDAVVYGLQSPADSGTGRVTPPESPESQMPRIVPDVLGHKSRALLARFSKTATDPRQRAFIDQLLALTA